MLSNFFISSGHLHLLHLPSSSSVLFSKYLFKVSWRVPLAYIARKLSSTLPKLICAVRIARFMVFPSCAYHLLSMNGGELGEPKNLC